MTVRKMIMRETYKIEVYLPIEALENIKQGLYKEGFGKIGDYEDCMSWYEIESSWKAMNGANPYLGEIGEIEVAKEYKLEFRCDECDLEKAINIIKENHPYEEVCINVIKVLCY